MVGPAEPGEVGMRSLGKSYDYPPPLKWRRENKCHKLEILGIDLENI